MTEIISFEPKQLLTPPKSDHFLGESIEEFLLLKSFKLKPKSVKTYSESLAALITFFGSELPVEEITESDLITWLKALEATRTPAGVFQVWQTAQFYFKWYFSAEPAADPMARIHLSRPKRDPITGISPEQVHKILKTLDGPNRVRDRALIAVLFASGLRKQEFCGLKIQDVNTVTGAIAATADRAKGGKFRQVHIQGKALLYLRRYVKAAADQRPEAALWQSQSGKPLTASGIHEILKRCSTDAKLPEVYDFHDYRRGCALAMHRAGADIKTISHFLGHADLKTTERYIALDDKDTARAAVLYDPLA